MAGTSRTVNQSTVQDLAMPKEAPGHWWLDPAPLLLVDRYCSRQQDSEGVVAASVQIAEPLTLGPRSAEVLNTLQDLQKGPPDPHLQKGKFAAFDLHTNRLS